MLIREKDWSIVEGRLCRAERFTPLARVENDKVVSAGLTKPYALIAFECVDKGAQIAAGTVGTIRHRLDFKNLWEAFVDRGISDDEVAVIVWSKNYSSYLAKLLSWFMPSLVIMIFKTRAFELLTKPSLEPDLRGEARYYAERPIAEWRPDVLK